MPLPLVTWMSPGPTASTPSCWPCRPTSRRSIAALAPCGAPRPAPRPTTDAGLQAPDGRGRRVSTRARRPPHGDNVVPMPQLRRPSPPGAIFWLEEALALDPGAPCPPLAGRARRRLHRGRGVHGAWTALELTARDPSLDVALLEPSPAVRAHRGATAGGRSARTRAAGADQSTTGRSTPAGCWRGRRRRRPPGAFAAEHGIDCHYRNGRAWGRDGAGAARRLGRHRSGLRRARAGGRRRGAEPDELRRRTGFAAASRRAARARHGDDPAGASWPAGCGASARARGSASRSLAARRGSHRGRPVAVVTPGRGRRGRSRRARDGRLVGRASRAAAGHRPRRHPHRPDRADRGADPGLGWTGGEAFGGARLLHYAQVTPGGRIAFGGGRWRDRPGGAGHARATIATRPASRSLRVSAASSPISTTCA